MPRNASGTYSLPTGNPVVSGTIITADWANMTMADFAAEMTSSLSRDGEGGMLAPLRNINGTALQPAITFTNDIQSGLYLGAVGEVVMSVAGTAVMRWKNGVAEVNRDGVWSSASGPDIYLDGELRASFTFPSLVLYSQVPGQPFPNDIAFRRDNDIPTATVGHIGNGELHVSNYVPGEETRIAVTGSTGTFDAANFIPDLLGTGKHGIQIPHGIQIQNIGAPIEGNIDVGLSIGHTSGGTRFGPQMIQTYGSGFGGPEGATLYLNAAGGTVQICGPAVGGEIRVADGSVIIGSGSETWLEVAREDLGGVQVASDFGMARVLNYWDRPGRGEVVTATRDITLDDRGKTFVVNDGIPYTLWMRDDDFTADDIGFTFFVVVTGAGSDCIINTDTMTRTYSGYGNDGNPHIPTGHLATVVLASLNHVFVSVA